ncbi:MAG: SgcJ/EcaC family oxidoreductase, partial [Aurantibacter sp.]
MKYILVVLFFGIAISSYAQDFDKAKEKAEIEKTLKVLVEAWTQGDAEKFSAPFAADADFTVWFGLKLKGKEEIAFGHNIIFKDFYANTIWNLRMDKIRFLSKDIALVHASGSVTKTGEPIPE